MSQMVFKGDFAIFDKGCLATNCCPMRTQKRHSKLKTSLTPAAFSNPWRLSTGRFTGWSKIVCSCVTHWTPLTTSASCDSMSAILVCHHRVLANGGDYWRHLNWWWGHIRHYLLYFILKIENSPHTLWNFTLDSCCGISGSSLSHCSWPCCIASGLLCINRLDFGLSPHAYCPLAWLASIDCWI